LTSYSQKENFKDKSASFFIHIHQYFNEKVADSLSDVMNKNFQEFKSQVESKNDSLPQIIEIPRVAYFDFKNVKYFRINPTEYIEFEIISKNDSIISEKNISNISMISRDSLLMTIFQIDKFKTYDYKFQKPYRDFSSFKLAKIDKENIKEIGGFSCYEVVLESENRKFKMFVTDEIKLNYHPVINDINILKNYYPLYIKVTDKNYPEDVKFTEYRFIRGEY
jgi:hypothetical protein